MNPLIALGYGALGLVGLSLAMITYAFASHPPTLPPELGRRGLKRKEAIDGGGLFATTEPVIRKVAGWVSRLPLGTVRQKIDVQLVYGGEWLGIRPDELLAMCLLSGGGLSLVGLAAADMVGLGPGLAVFFGLLGLFVPYTRLTAEVQDRVRRVSRQLPVAIDLAALCMGAGLDFPGAIRQVVEKSPNRKDPLVEEMGRILQELEFGRTRRQALESFRDRVPSDVVADFVGAVVQAEEKGNPLAEVLRIQAHMLRMRRSVMAEEAAAKAGVMMVAPLMLIFCAIVLLLLGPFVLKGMDSGF